VVKTNLDKLGGQTEIASKPGQGTTIRIKLPLTLAIIPSQIVTVGRERYAIPQVNLVELLRIPAARLKSRLETVGDAEVVRLRDDLLPLVRLADIIGIQRCFTAPQGGEEKPDRRHRLADRRSPRRAGPDDAPATTDTDKAAAPPHRREAPFDRRQRAASAMNIAVVAAGPLKYGLVVDGMLDSEEIVVKPLGRHLKACRGYAGATIMGDGRVALILDVAYLAHMAGLNRSENADAQNGVRREEQETTALADEIQSMLVFRCGIGERFAVPVGLVERIEKILSTDIEQIGGKRVMQYRGGSLPLFSIDQVARVQPLAANDSHLVIVFNLAGRELGLLATGPVDAVEVNMNVDGQTLRQPGVMGSMVIDGHTTLMVDIYELVHTLEPEWFAERQGMEKVPAATILYAEDSAFFRSQVRRVMEEEGFSVIEAEDGARAWELLQEHADEISLVATDIEMPNMDGFAFTEKIRSDERFAHLPVIALTTLTSEADQARGKAAGVDDYQIKLDRERLIGSLRRLLVPA
jgi:two-component system chemotaxis sensor kinase CheA